ETSLERRDVIDDGSERVHSQPRHNVARLQIAHTTNVQLPDVEVRHAVHRGSAPSRCSQHCRRKNNPGKIPIAGLFEPLGKLQGFLGDDIRMSRSSPAVITTSPDCTSVDRASASAGRSPRQMSAPPADAIARCTRSELTPGIACSRDGYSSVRKIASAPDSARPKSSAKSRVRL